MRTLYSKVSFTRYSLVRTQRKEKPDLVMAVAMFNRRLSYIFSFETSSLIVAMVRLIAN